MLTDEEWTKVGPLLQKTIEGIKELRSETGAGLQEALDSLRHQACQRYYEITGFRETNPNAIWHHRLSDYGPECPQCGHLFRTPNAAFCAACGFRPIASSPSIE